MSKRSSGRGGRSSAAAAQQQDRSASVQLITAEGVKRFDKVIPLIGESLKDFRIGDEDEPDVVFAHIIKSLDDTKVNLVKEMGELNSILTNGILAIQRNITLGTDAKKDAVLRNVMRGFVSVIKRRTQQLAETSPGFSVLLKRAEVLEEQSEELRADTLKAEQRATEAESDKEELTSEIRDKDLTIERLTRENETLESTEKDHERSILQNSKRERDTLKLQFESQLNDLEERLRRSRDDCTKKEAESRSSEHSVRQLTRERDAAQVELEELTTQKKRAEEDATLAKRDTSSAERDLEILQSSVKKLEDSLDAAENSKDRLEGRVKDLQSQIKGDKSQMVRESSEAAALNEQVKGLTKELRDLETTCAKSSVELDELQATLRDRNIELLRLQQDDSREKEDIQGLRRERERRQEELVKTRDQLEDAREEARERARKPSPVPKGGEQWKYKIKTLDTCAIGLKECPHPNGKTIVASKYIGNTSPPSISLTIDTFDKQENKAIEVTSLTIGFKDGTEKANESPVAFTFTPADKKPLLDRSVKVTITPTAPKERTSIRFVGFDIDMKLDSATFDPLFLASKGQTAVITVILQDKNRKVHRDSVALAVSRWDTTAKSSRSSVREDTKKRREASASSESIPVARRVPAGSVEMLAENDALRIGTASMSFTTKVPTFRGEPGRVLDSLVLSLAAQSSPKRVLTVCGADNKVQLLDSTLFSLSPSGQQGLSQGTDVTVQVFPYGTGKGSRSTDNAIIVEYDPVEGEFDPRTGRKLAINVYLCKESNVSRFDAAKEHYIFTLSGQSSAPSVKKVFVERVAARETSGLEGNTVSRRVARRKVASVRRRGSPATSSSSSTTPRSTAAKRPGTARVGADLFSDDDVFDRTL